MSIFDKPRLTPEERQREEAQEARWQSNEHGAPETGPGEDVVIETPVPEGEDVFPAGNGNLTK